VARNRSTAAIRLRMVQLNPRPIVGQDGACGALADGLGAGTATGLGGRPAVAPWPRPAPGSVAPCAEHAASAATVTSPATTGLSHLRPTGTAARAGHTNLINDAAVRRS
jgi:hypothetical protein